MDSGQSSASLTGTRAARATLARAVFVLSVAPVAGITLLSAAGLQAPHYAGYAVFAVSMVFLGLPHGALDHLVPARMTSSISTPTSILTVGLVYLVLAAAYLTLWFLAPVLAFALFIILTWFHWGQGDLWYLLNISGVEHQRTRSARILTIFVRGGLPMLVPLLAFPDVYRSVAANTTSLFGMDVTTGLWIFGTTFRYAAGGVFIALTLLCLIGVLRNPGLRKRAWRTDVAETVLLALYFTLVPPVLAVGVYFCLWHAPRHIARLMLLDDGSVAALARGGLSSAAANFLRDSAPLTLAALVLLAILYWIVPERATGAQSLLGLYLVTISILTLPHVAVVSWMDLQRKTRR